MNWLGVREDFPVCAEMALNIRLAFCTVFLGQEVFLALTIIKPKY